MPQNVFAGEKLEPLGGGYYAITSKNHTFSADAILLADFAAPRGAKKLCDLCAGCGIVSLIWSADVSSRIGAGLFIDAVEIQSEAADMIKRAAEYNNLPCLRGVEADLRTLGASFNGNYDLVACNPPYKKAGTGAQSRDSAALAARHETLCSLEDVVSAGARLLKNGGRFCLCHRPERLCDLVSLMRTCGVEPKRLRHVQQRVSTRPWLVLIEGKKGGRPGLLVEPALIVEGADGGYSNEMSEIYNKLNR